MIHDLLGRYWDAAYAEGMEGRNHDTEDGIAQQTLNDILAEFSAKDNRIAELEAMLEKYDAKLPSDDWFNTMGDE